MTKKTCDRGVITGERDKKHDRKVLTKVNGFLHRDFL